MLNLNCQAASREWHHSFVYCQFYACEVRLLRIVIYSHLSPSHLLLSMGTNSLVLRITLKYYGGDHKTRLKRMPILKKRRPHTKTHPSKTEIRSEETQCQSLSSD